MELRAMERSSAARTASDTRYVLERRLSSGVGSVAGASAAAWAWASTVTVQRAPLLAGDRTLTLGSQTSPGTRGLVNANCVRVPLPSSSVNLAVPVSFDAPAWRIWAVNVAFSSAGTRTGPCGESRNEGPLISFTFMLEGYAGAKISKSSRVQP